MRPLVFLLLLLATAAVLCGCTGRPEAAPTPTPAVPITSFALVRDDLPFTAVMDQDLRFGPTDPLFRYVPAATYGKAFSDAYTEREIRRSLSQRIWELTEENATAAFALLRNEAVEQAGSADPAFNVTINASVKAGDESVAYVVSHPGSTRYRFNQTVLVFRKGRYVGMLNDQAPDPAFAEIAGLGSLAASWIPAGRPVTVTPSPAGGGGAGLVPLRPLTVTADAPDTAGKLNFTLTSPGGSLPLGPGETRFSVQVPSMGGYLSLATGDSAVTVAWPEGHAGTVLPPGGTAEITLDLRAAGMPVPAKNARQGIAILVTGPGGGTQFSCRTSAQSMAENSSYPCS